MACIGLVSCDFDQYSPNSLPFEKGFETIGNIQALERGAYASLRTAVSPECMIVPDLQADYANAVYGYSNTYGGMYEWTFTQEESEVEAVWQNFYGGIGQFNFIIDGIDFRLALAEADGEELPADEVAEMNRIKGNMFFMRALSYSILAERFCADYDESTADREYSGLPLVLKYDPDGRPSRSTLRQVYVAISDDLKEAPQTACGRTRWSGCDNFQYRLCDCARGACPPADGQHQGCACQGKLTDIQPDLFTCGDCGGFRQDVGV